MVNIRLRRLGQIPRWGRVWGVFLPVGSRGIFSEYRVVISAPVQCFIQTLGIGGWRLLGRLPNEARRAENRGQRPRSGVGREGQKAPSPPATEGLGGAVTESRPPKGFPLFSALRMASPDTMILLMWITKNYPIQSWVNYCEIRDAVWRF